MFKRDNEQPVKASFEEKNEKRTRRSLRERLSNIPLRRRVEAVILAVVTIMASLSIDWSSLVARASEDTGEIESGWSISQVYSNSLSEAGEVTTLKTATISVQKPSLSTSSISYSWKVYQNLSVEGDPESGALVKQSDEIKIDFSGINTGEFKDCEVNLGSAVTLLENETAAVVFTLSSSNGGAITYKTSGINGQVHYLKDGYGWTENTNSPGKCITYGSEKGGTLEPVNLSGTIPSNLVMKAGESSSFDVKWTPAYKRIVKLEEVDNSGLISITEDSKKLAFRVKNENEIGNGGVAKIKVCGEGVKESDPVSINVVSFVMNNDGAFTYKGEKFTEKDLLTVKCGGTDVLNDTNNYKITFSGDTINNYPVDAGSYSLKFSGKGSYSGLEYTKDFSIAPKELETTMFNKENCFVKDSKIQSITGAKFNNMDLIEGVDFEAKIKKTVATTDGITHTIAISGIGNFIGTVEIDGVKEQSGTTALGSVVGRIEFKDSEGLYKATEQYPEVVFYDKDGKDISSSFTKNVNYEIKYFGKKRDTDEEVSNADFIKDAGEYTATVTGKGIYGGEGFSTMSTDPLKPYILKPVSLSGGDGGTTEIKLKQSYFESSDSLKVNPEVSSVTYTPSGSSEVWRLAAGTDYEMENNKEYKTAIGTYTVTVFGRGNYGGKIEGEYTVFPSLASATFALEGTTNGEMKKAEDTDAWDYVWSHHGSFPYTGDEFNPSITANVNGHNLSVANGDLKIVGKGNNTDVSTEGNKAYFIVALPEEYANKKIKVEFEIAPDELEEEALIFRYPPVVKNYAYGTPVTLAKSEYYVKNGEKYLKEGTDYTISYENNVNAGKAKVIATGMGNYTGTSEKTFSIEAIDVKDLDISIGLQILNKSGDTEITNMDDVVIKVEGMDSSPFTADDFTLKNYDNNNKAWMSGDAGPQPQVTIEGKRNLKGEDTLYFEIKKESLKGVTWKLTETNLSGKLGEPGATIDLSKDYNFYLDYSTKLPAMTINLEDNGVTLVNNKDYIRPTILPKAGLNSFEVKGKGNYADEKYFFTFEVRKLDISNCEVTQTDDGSVDELPKFTLTYNGNPLTPGDDYVTDLETVVNKEKEGGKYKLKDYTVTITGAGNYTGTRSEKIHIGKPFNSDNVFITMYGPTGTKTENGENRLTYFGDNDPYFILTSDKTGSSEEIVDPTYAKGAHDPNTGDYNITFEPSDPDEMHKVGTTVKVTFTAKKDNGVWYNPGNEGITYFYKVMPGVGASVTGYPNLQKRLSIFTDYTNATPQEGAKKDFPETVTNNLIQFSGFEFPYTTEGIDPEIYICYDPKIESGACATECSSGGVPSAPTDENIYAEPKKVKFNDSSLFTVSKGLISANDEDKKIIMTPVRTGWLGASQNPPKIEVDYKFTAAKLSAADITFTPSANYTYSGSPADVSYSVKLGRSTLREGTDYQPVGYYKIPDDNAIVKKAIDDALSDPSSIKEETLETFGTKIDGVPTDTGKYVLVIGPATNNNNYTGYNIKEFSIGPGVFTAQLKDPDFSVPYKGNKNAPAAGDLGDLIVVGVNGEKLKAVSAGSTDDGYYIVEETGANQRPRKDAEVTVVGTGNYKDRTQKVQYMVKADITPGKTPDFSKTNLSLDDHTDSNNCLRLTLKDDDGLPLIEGTGKAFDISTLELEDGNEKIESAYLTAKVSGESGDDSLTTIGKKMITVSGAAGAPVEGTRIYYVEVFGDISTARSITLQTDGAVVPEDHMISYTGQSIRVTPRVNFKGRLLDVNCYKVTNNGESTSYTEVGSYEIDLKGNEEKYYIGTPQIKFSIVYDLRGDYVTIHYSEKDDNEYTPLAGKGFPYTGDAIGPTIKDKIQVRMNGKPEKKLVRGSDYTLDFANDTFPGDRTAKVKISPVSGRSINEQTVAFSIDGIDITEKNCTLKFASAEEIVYDGTQKTPEVVVSYFDGKDSRTLTRDSDYKVTYSNNINATTKGSKATVTIDGINGRYVGNIQKTFEIAPKPLKDADVSFPDVPFGGRDESGKLLPSTPAITVNSDGTALVEEKDYEIKYGNGENAKSYFTKNPGEEYTITVTGKGNYSETAVTKKAKQLSGSLKGTNINIYYPSGQDTHVYNGRKVTFSTEPEIRNGSSKLTKGKDYSLKIPEMINAGTYEIEITALSGGDYYVANGSVDDNTRKFSYVVEKRPMEENEGAFVTTLFDPVTKASVPRDKGFTFVAGTKIEPKVKIVDTGISGHAASVRDTWTNDPGSSADTIAEAFTLTYGVDKNYGENKEAGKNAGSVTLTAKADSNYTGSITIPFNIGQDISGAKTSYTDGKSSVNYDGEPKAPALAVTYDGKALTAGTEYESPVEYSYTSAGESVYTSAPTDAGVYVPIIKGRPEGGYYGEKQGDPFRIIPQDKSGDIEITFEVPGGETTDYNCEYTAEEQKPAIRVYDTSSGTRVLIPEGNYTATYRNNVNVGPASVEVDLEKNYSGSEEEYFFINRRDISNMTLSLAEGENGVIKNIPESSFPYTPLFKLTGKDDNGEELVISSGDSRLSQYLVVSDEAKAKKPGEGTLKVSGTGNLTGTTGSVDYKIYGKLSDSNVSVKPPIYTGTKKDPEVTVAYAGQELVKDTDYSLKILPSAETGRSGGEVVVKGLGYFSGTVLVKYSESGDVSSLELRGYGDTYIYSGKFAGPEESTIYVADSEGNKVISEDNLECTFKSDVDNTACIEANAKVTITTKATLDDGTVVEGPSATYRIEPRNISSCDIKQLTRDNYTGRALTPPVSVSYDRKTYSDRGSTQVIGHDVSVLTEGKDYSLIYQNNINPGTAELIVVGKGNFTGTKRFLFSINVPDMVPGTVHAKRSQGGVTVEWKARPHVTGYQVLYNENGSTKARTRETTITLKDALPTRVAVQTYVEDATGKVTYGMPYYVDVD